MERQERRWLPATGEGCGATADLAEVEELLCGLTQPRALDIYGARASAGELRHLHSFSLVV